MRSRINIESFMIVYFFTFLSTIVFTFIIIDDFRSFKILYILRDIFFVSALILFWNFFFKIHTKIIITDGMIIFKKFFKTETIKIDDLDFCFEKIERAKYQSYNVLYLVKDNRVVERISSFDYSNYIDLKKKLNLTEYQYIRFSVFDMIRILFGVRVSIAKK